MKKLLLLLMAVSGCTYTYNQTVNFSPARQDFFTLTTEVKESSIFEISGQLKENSTEKLITRSVRVLEKEKNRISFLLTLDRIIVKVKAGENEINFDSDKKDNPMALTESFGKNIGTSKTITVDKTGRKITTDNSSIMVLAGLIRLPDLALINSSLLGRAYGLHTTWRDSSIIVDGKGKDTLSGVYQVIAIDKNIANVKYTGTVRSEGLIKQMDLEFPASSLCDVNSEFEIEIGSGIIFNSTTALTGIMHIDTQGTLIPVNLNLNIKSILKQVSR